MARRTRKVLNREQSVFCCALVLLAGCALVLVCLQATPHSALRSLYSSLFGCVPPEILAKQAPLTVLAPPPPYRTTGMLPVPEPGDTSRATPFAPPPETGHVIVPPVDGWWRRTLEESRQGLVSSDLKPKPTLSTTWSRPVLLDGDSPVTYMGVLGASGQRLGMLRVKNGQFLNVREGDKLADLGCTIIRVEKEAIHLMTRTGVYHILHRPGS